MTARSLRSPVADFFRQLEVSCWAEGVDPLVAQRIINRLLTGSPDGTPPEHQEDSREVLLNSVNAQVRQAMRDHISRQLKRARLKSGVTQADAAKFSGMPRQAIWEAEQGRRGVSAVELVLLAFLYDRPLTYFITMLPPQDAALAALDAVEEGARNDG